MSLSREQFEKIPPMRDWYELGRFGHLQRGDRYLNNSGRWMSIPHYWIGKSKEELGHHQRFIRTMNNLLIFKPKPKPKSTRKLKEVEFLKGEKYRLVKDRNYILKYGDRINDDNYPNFQNSPIVEAWAGGMAGYHMDRNVKSNLVFYEKVLPKYRLINQIYSYEQASKEIPNGYALIELNEIIQPADYFWHTLYGWTTCYGWSQTGRTRQQIDKKNVIRFIKPTPEQQIELKKEESKDFVDYHIENPTRADYEKFEQAFLKDGDFGL